MKVNVLVGAVLILVHMHSGVRSCTNAFPLSCEDVALQDLTLVLLVLRAVVEQMKIDEAQHAQTAVDHGGAPLPAPVKWVMRRAADVMRQTASRI